MAKRSKPNFWAELPLQEKIKYVAIAVGLVVVLTGIRSCQLQKYPTGDTQSVVSPNELGTAYLSHFSDRGFFGGSSEYFFLEVKKRHPAGGEFVVFTEKIESADVPVKVDLAEIKDHVKWTRDSTVVMYEFGALKIRVDMPL